MVVVVCFMLRLLSTVGDLISRNGGRVSSHSRSITGTGNLVQNETSVFNRNICMFFTRDSLSIRLVFAKRANIRYLFAITNVAAENI
jgi:hypothetical protein